MRYALAAVFLASSPALAQEPPQLCGPSNAVEKRIASQYGESPVGAGITPQGIVLVVTNPETNTFTILLRRKDGMTCLIAGGSGFATIEAIKPGVDL